MDIEVKPTCKVEVTAVYGPNQMIEGKTKIHLRKTSQIPSGFNWRVGTKNESDKVLGTHGKEHRTNNRKRLV